MYESDKKPLELSTLDTLADDDVVIVGDTSDTNEVVKSFTWANLKTALSTFFSTIYATVAQGALADSAVQPGDNISTLTNDAGYITADDQTASQVPFTPAGTLAATNVQAALEELDADIQALGTGGVTDHGALTGLGDDDHPQYHNDTRGDARYSQLGHTHTASQVTDFQATVSTNTDVAANTTARHTHSNKTTLDAIQEALTTALKTAYDTASSWVTTNGATVLAHLSSTSNPHSVTKAQVGLGSVPDLDTTTAVSQTHARSHSMASASDHTATAHRVFYSDASGVVTELAFGANGTYLKSNGTSSAPSFDTPPGGGGGISRSVAVTSGNVTAGSTAATDYVYFVAGAHTVSLPSASGNTNLYTIKNNHSANVTVDTVGAETIDGTASISIAPEESVQITSDGTNFYVI